MSSVKRFEDLKVWQRARSLVKEVYELSNREPFSKDFGLKNQFRRAAVSVMNNISEGFESRTVNGFINYLGLARASCGETRSMLYVALDQNYITKNDFDKRITDCKVISKQISRFIKYLENYDSNDRVKEIGIEYDV